MYVEAWHVYVAVVGGVACVCCSSRWCSCSSCVHMLHHLLHTHTRTHTHSRSAEEREKAIIIFKALAVGKALVEEKKEKSGAAVCETMKAVLRELPAFEV